MDSAQWIQRKETSRTFPHTDPTASHNHNNTTQLTTNPSACYKPCLPVGLPPSLSLSIRALSAPVRSTCLCGGTEHVEQPDPSKPGRGPDTGQGKERSVET